MAGDRLMRILDLLAPGEDGSPTPSLCEVCAVATSMTGAGVMLMLGDLPHASVCSSDSISAQLEDVQFALGEGPCIDAFSSDTPVLEPDLSSPAQVRWTQFSREALALGARAVFGFPMQVGGVRVGAMNLYRSSPGPLSDDQHADSIVMAGVAARQMLAAQSTAEPGYLANEIETGADFRFVVHQATGMVAAQLDVSVADAMIRLRAYAMANDRPLRDVSEDIVARRLRLT